MDENENENEKPFCDPEDCWACGNQAGEFGDEDFANGTWNCPDCGEPQ